MVVATDAAAGATVATAGEGDAQAAGSRGPQPTSRPKEELQRARGSVHESRARVPRPRVVQQGRSS
eukprot:scaffold104201_cov54-Phaeocystis_antarctica.AAC.1